MTTSLIFGNYVVGRNKIVDIFKIYMVYLIMLKLGKKELTGKKWREKRHI